MYGADADCVSHGTAKIPSTTDLKRDSYASCQCLEEVEVSRIQLRKRQLGVQRWFVYDTHRHSRAVCRWFRQCCPGSPELKFEAAGLLQWHRKVFEYCKSNDETI
jgi:hypothetical protein